MTLYFHPTITKKKGKLRRRATVAGVVAEVEGRPVIKIGVAVCSNKDQFVKKVGRAKAEGRANSSDKGYDTITTVADDYKAQLKDFLQAAIDALTDLGFNVLPKAKNTENLAV